MFLCSYVKADPDGIKRRDLYASGDFRTIISMIETEARQRIARYERETRAKPTLENLPERMSAIGREVRIFQECNRPGAAKQRIVREHTKHESRPPPSSLAERLEARQDYSSRLIDGIAANEAHATNFPNERQWPSSETFVTVEMYECMRFLRQLNRGSAAGPDGFPYSLLALRAVLKEQAIIFAAIANLAYANKLPPHLVTIVSASNGLSIPKERSTGWRPLGVRTATARALGSLLLSILKKRGLLASAAGALQFGCAVRSGTSLASLSVRLAIDEDAHAGRAPRALTATDISNAFQSPSRLQLAWALKSNAPELLPLFTMLYSRAPAVILDADPNLPLARVMSTAGVLQGCSLGSAVFCIGHRRYVETTQQQLQELLPSTPVGGSFFADDAENLHDIRVAAANIALSKMNAKIFLNADINVSKTMLY